MNRLLQHARRHAKRWVWGCLMLLLTNATTMAVPQLFRFAVDGIRENAPVEVLHQIALTLVLVAVAGMLFRTLSRIHILYAARDVELDLRCTFYAHLTTLEPAFYQTHPTGDLMSRATNDLTQVRLMLGPGLLNMVNTVVAYATALPLMCMISVKLTLISFAVYPPAILLMRMLGKRLYARNRRQQESLGQLSNVVQENLAGAQLVRAFAVEGEQERAFLRMNDAYLESNIALAWTRSGMFRVAMSLATVGTLATVYFGAYDVLAHRISLGEIVALVEYMALLSWPTFAMGFVMSMWQRGAASMARLEEILAVAPRIVSGAPLQQGLPPTVRVQDLTVRYAERVSVDKVSFEVPAGHVLGIVGPIGSGKSALVRALLRLVDSAGGDVWVGNKNIRAMDLGGLRSMFGYVPQNPSLFSKSVAENVAFGRPAAPAEAIAAAVEAAALTADLAALPQGLETQVGERGVTLSGGQKQRTAIARALLLDPPILILDDALSAVDGETEATILAHLRAARVGRTTLIVAHRISAVQHADHIIVMNEGAIAERGTHSSLVAQQGLYAAMAKRQEMAKVAQAALQ